MELKPYSLRVLSLNLWHDNYKREPRIASLIKFIDESQVDILLFQESCQHNELSVAQEISKFSRLNFMVEDINNAKSGNGVLSAYPISESISIPLQNEERCAVLARIAVGQRPVDLISTHNTWGPGREHIRLNQVISIDQVVKTRTEYDATLKSLSSPVTILGGDFNCTEDSDSIRFLRGLKVVDNTSTLWTDTFRSLHSEPGFTSTLENPLAVITAQQVGLNTEFTIPPRRIDFIMSYGYAYGKAGACINSYVVDQSIIEENFPSDHYGIVSDIIL